MCKKIMKVDFISTGNLCPEICSLDVIQMQNFLLYFQPWLITYTYTFFKSNDMRKFSFLKIYPPGGQTDCTLCLFWC